MTGARAPTVQEYARDFNARAERQYYQRLDEPVERSLSFAFGWWRNENALVAGRREARRATARVREIRNGVFG